MKVAGMTTAGQAFLEARDFLLRHRTDYDTAVRDFEWPVLDRFNWALDYFDPIATGNAKPALHIVGEDGTETLRSFSDMSVRSNQVANFLRANGVRRGDCLLLMLGNEVALWEVLLAAMKIGALVSPASTLLTVEDLQDRIDRGQVRHVIAGCSQASKFATVKGDVTKIVVGGEAPGWIPFESSALASGLFEPTGETGAHDPLLLYFTSGTTAKPKIVLHTHQI